MMQDRIKPELSGQPSTQMFGILSIFHRLALMGRLISWIVLFAGLLLTFTAWYFARDEANQRAQTSFNFRVKTIVTGISERLQTYEFLLQGGGGLFSISDEVTRDDWRTYVDSLQINQYYPGVQGVGFSKRILRSEKETHIRQIRDEGFPQYTIHPDGERSEYTSIIFLEPFDWRNQRAFGYDMFFQPTRKEAMVRARDTGKAALSGKVTLVQETDKDIQSGFLIYQAIYHKGRPHGTPEQRRKNLLGYVYSPFRMNDFMKGILAEEGGYVNLQIFDGDKPLKESLLFQSEKAEELRNHPEGNHFATNQVFLEYANHSWLLSFVSSKYFEENVSPGSLNFILVLGLTISILLFGMVLSLSKSHSQAISLANTTEDLEKANIGLKKEIESHQKTNSALLESKAMFQAAMDYSQAGIAIAKAPDGELIYVNNSALGIRGETKEKIVNGIGIDQYVTSWQILHFDGTPYENEEVPLARAIMFGETCSKEFIVRRPDQEDRIVWANAAPIKNENNEIIYGIVVFLDITKRKKAEEDLRFRESQYTAIVESSGDYIMRYDKNHRHIFANRRAIESTGLPREHYLDKTHREMGFPEDLCILWEKNIDEVFSTGEVRKVDFDVELSDSWMSLELQLSPEFDKEGQVHSVIGVSRDVTERRTAQREDKLNKARLEILHTIRDMDDTSEKNICDMALEKMVELSGSDIGFLGFIVDNEQTMEIHAWSASAMDKCAIHGKPMAFPIDQAGLWGEPVRNREPIIYNDYNVPHSAKKGYPEGHVPVNRFMSVPVFDGDTIVAIAAVANKSNPYDTIDQNQLEMMMGSVWDLIQRRRMEKEKEMLVSQLQKVQKMESIGNLAGGIAHDFNNILFPIVGMSEMLLEDLPSDSLEWENAQEIFTAGKRGSELVKQILAFSRQNKNQLSPTRLQFVMKEVLKLSRSSIPANIEISQHLQQDCSLILADSTQLHQIGMNLITNAYHAVQDTDGKINVEVREFMINDENNDLKLPLGKYVTLKVEDNGTGIKKGHLDNIFEPYFTTKKQGKGTGLGLAVVYGIVKEYKGGISVKSEQGKGTCFQIYLPVIASLKDTEVATEPIHLETGNENILLVDDELPILKLEKQILERLGYKVNERSSSPEALKAFSTNPDAYDLVITDMSMPNMTGENLAKELQKIRPDIPIIICTGFSERINKEQAEMIGVKGFLMKPVIKSDMAQMVRKVLDEAKVYKGN